MNDVTIADLASYNTSAIFYDGLNEFTLTDAIEYQTASTPVIDTVLPRTGSVYGGQVITLTGSNLDLGTAEIMIDGIECAVDSGATTSTSLSCTTG